MLDLLYKEDIDELMIPPCVIKVGHPPTSIANVNFVCLCDICMVAAFFVPVVFQDLASISPKAPTSNFAVAVFQIKIENINNGSIRS